VCRSCCLSVRSLVCFFRLLPVARFGCGAGVRSREIAVNGARKRCDESRGREATILSNEVDTS
jgi:hypothetical protein